MKASDLNLGDFFTYCDKEYLCIYKGKHGVTTIDVYTHEISPLKFYDTSVSKVYPSKATSIEELHNLYPEYFI